MNLPPIKVVKPVIPTILHVLGNTGSGKTTVMELVCERNPRRASGISVGKELRKRYPPDYFEGQAAPQKTELEAMQIYREFVDYHTNPESHAQLILVDGQPRNTSQVAACLQVPTPGWRHEFLLFHVGELVRWQRLINRDAASEGALALANQRLTGDYKNTYEVMIEIARLGLKLQILDASETPLRIARRIEHEYL
jgi:adenylate kinase family enzyme